LNSIGIWKMKNVHASCTESIFLKYHSTLLHTKLPYNIKFCHTFFFFNFSIKTSHIEFNFVIKTSSKLLLTWFIEFKLESFDLTWHCAKLKSYWNRYLYEMLHSFVDFPFFYSANKTIAWHELEHINSFRVIFQSFKLLFLSP
jgi:hypothetical protein